MYYTNWKEEIFMQYIWIIQSSSSESKYLKSFLFTIKSCVKLMIVMSEHFDSIALSLYLLSSISVSLLMSTLCIVYNIDEVDEYWFVLYVNEPCLNQNDLYGICKKKRISAKIDLMIWFMCFMKTMCYIWIF